MTIAAADMSRSPESPKHPTPLEVLREPSPYLVALARAYLLAPSNTSSEHCLDQIIAFECERQGIEHARLLDRPEFYGLEPEER